LIKNKLYEIYINSVIYINYIMTTTYEIEPSNKSAIYTIEEWHITTSTGSDVILLYTQCWDYGTFEITVDEDKIDKLITSTPIIINDNGGCVNTLEMGWYYEHKIKNVDKYTDEEIKEINRLIYTDIDESGDNDDTDYDEECVDTGRLEDNGWTLEDTIYEVYDGVEIIGC